MPPHGGTALDAGINFIDTVGGSHPRSLLAAEDLEGDDLVVDVDHRVCDRLAAG